MLWNAPTPLVASCAQWMALACDPSLPLDAVVTKTLTCRPVINRERHKVWVGVDMALNHVALENMGLDRALSTLEALSDERVRAMCRPLVLSLAVQREDSEAVWRPYLARILSCVTRGVVLGVELNLVCPNVEGVPPCTSAYNPVDSSVHSSVHNPCFPLFLYVARYLGTRCVVGVKLPAMLTPPRCTGLLDTFFETTGVYPAYVVCCNALPGGRVLHTNTNNNHVTPVLSRGSGAVSGSVVNRAISMHMLHALAPYCEQHGICLVACGGISSGRHVLEAVATGACMVQIGTQWMREGNGVFARLGHETRCDGVMCSLRSRL